MKGKLEINPNGSGFFISDDGEKTYVYKKNTGVGLDQDIVEIKLIEGKVKGTTEGSVVKVLERNRTKFTGIVQKVKDYGFLVTDSKRIPDFFLRREQVSKYKMGEKLLAEIGNWKAGSSPNCKIVKSLGMIGENDAEMDSILYGYGLNPNFSVEVEKESEDIDWNISDEEIKRRRDFRNITTLTIDPSTAKDFDDAISIMDLGNGDYEIGVHIADVSHYVKKGSHLDKEALKRGNSVYLVDRVIPMIPERLSNGVCSLRPNEDKLTYSVVFKLNIDGKIKDKWIGRTIIHSDKRFDYRGAQDIIEGIDTGEYSEEVTILNTISQNLRKKRNSLLFNRTEVKFKLDRDFVPVGIELEENNESHQLIEELMLLANKTIGEHLHKKGNGVYRTHDTPNQDKILELKQISSILGFDLDIMDIKKGLNQLSLDIKDTPYENMIQMLSIRTMSKAEYETNSVGHYGLGFDYYTHFTSPIRRYSDLMAHRLLDTNLNNNFEMSETCKHINGTEMNAKKAERESIKFKQVQYLLGKVGQVFMGTISGVSDWGAYVELSDSKCEGLIKLDNIDGGVEKDKYKITTGGKEYFLGDSVMVKVHKVSLLKKEIDFVIM
jgi:ribonuclease R